jgi:hypothetical protein
MRSEMLVVFGVLAAFTCVGVALASQGWRWTVDDRFDCLEKRVKELEEGR